MAQWGRVGGEVGASSVSHFGTAALFRTPSLSRARALVSRATGRAMASAEAGPMGLRRYFGLPGWSLEMTGWQDGGGRAWATSGEDGSRRRDGRGDECTVSAAMAVGRCAEAGRCRRRGRGRGEERCRRGHHQSELGGRHLDRFPESSSAAVLTPPPLSNPPAGLILAPGPPPCSPFRPLPFFFFSSFCSPPVPHPPLHASAAHFPPRRCIAGRKTQRSQGPSRRLARVPSHRPPSPHSARQPWRPIRCTRTSSTSP